MSKASIEALDELHGVVADTLTRRIRAGEATAADISAAIKFLKDNGIEQLAVAGSPIANLVASLPFAGSDGPSH